MVIKEHERLLNITLIHKLKQRKITFIAVLHVTVTVGSSTNVFFWPLCCLLFFDIWYLQTLLLVLFLTNIQVFKSKENDVLRPEYTYIYYTLL